LFPGYVRVEVVAGSEIKSATLDIPQNTRAVIELVPGVIRILGSGSLPSE
jgi:transcription antitermination factor NusG